MCGRFVAATTPGQLGQFFDAGLPDVDLAERYNVAPTAHVYTIISDADVRRSIEAMRWGLLPHWATSQAGKPLFNARAETLATNRSFARSFQQRRCLIPADGFYEWTTDGNDGSKQPHYIMHRDGDPLAFAGIWRTWHEPKTDNTLDTCTIITCPPNQTMESIHDRMPVILAPTSWGQWLNPTTRIVNLTKLLGPAPNELLTTHLVSTDVNSARNDRPQLVQPIKKP